MSIGIMIMAFFYTCLTVMHVWLILSQDINFGFAFLFVWFFVLIDVIVVLFLLVLGIFPEETIKFLEIRNILS